MASYYEKYMVPFEKNEFEFEFEISFPTFDL